MKFSPPKPDYLVDRRSYWYNRHLDSVPVNPDCHVRALWSVAGNFWCGPAHYRNSCRFFIKHLISISLDQGEET